jgi:hypothetical protein
MKVYVIKKGTPVVLISESGNRKEIVSKAEVSFSDYIVDPVSVWNNSRENINYAQYRLQPEMLSKGNEEFTKVEVNYDYVEVLC